MFLTSANTLSATLAVAVNTTAPNVLVDFADLATSTYTPTNQVATLSNSPTTILAAPAGSTIRQVKYINIHNTDDIAHTVTVTQVTGTTLVNKLIPPGDLLTWSVETGWVSSVPATTFDDLTDTPVNKVGEALKVIRVNAGETALEYTDANTFDQDLNTTDGASFTNVKSTTENGTTPAAGEGDLRGEADFGAVIIGQGAIYDSSAWNKNRTFVWGNLTGTLNMQFEGDINVDGTVRAGAPTGSSAGQHGLAANITDDIINIQNHHPSNPFGINLEYTAAAPNGTGNDFLVVRDSSAIRFQLRSNGGIANFQSNDVDLSDPRTKNIKGPLSLEEASELIDGIEVIEFQHKDQTNDNMNIGVNSHNVPKRFQDVAIAFVAVQKTLEIPVMENVKIKIPAVMGKEPIVIDGELGFKVVEISPARVEIHSRQVTQMKTVTVPEQIKMVGGVLTQISEHEEEQECGVFEVLGVFEENGEPAMTEDDTDGFTRVFNKDIYFALLADHKKLKADFYKAMAGIEKLGNSET